MGEFTRADIERLKGLEGRVEGLEAFRRAFEESRRWGYRETLQALALFAAVVDIIARRLGM